MKRKVNCPTFKVKPKAISHLHSTGGLGRKNIAGKQTTIKRIVARSKGGILARPSLIAIKFKPHKITTIIPKPTSRLFKIHLPPKSLFI